MNKTLDWIIQIYQDWYVGIRYIGGDFERSVVYFSHRSQIMETGDIFDDDYILDYLVVGENGQQKS